ncbi:MAG: B12-binding domain-containing radical SAM protein [Elusimicrobia bacterium]|nr:B12-binding domain-containing radical SAM protein [Elusimicrobiota bacterium]
MPHGKKQLKPDIIFVSLKSADKIPWAFVPSYSLGTAYIIAYLEKHGIPAAQLTSGVPMTTGELADSILTLSPRAVGFTVYDTDYCFARIMSRTLKEADPGLIIAAGGPAATFADDLIMKDTEDIDYCIRGEGEITVYELLKAIRENRPVGNIKGITFRESSKIRRNEDRAPVSGGGSGSELDILPSPYLNGILPEGPDFGIYTSRGCAYSCSFCAPTLGRKVRYHSVDRVIGELKLINSLDTGGRRKTVTIHDSCFSFNTGRARDLCRRIKGENIKLDLVCETRIDRLDGETLALLKDAGFCQIDVGFETAVPRLLKKIKKVRACGEGLAPEIEYVAKTRENIRLARDRGINIAMNLITGLPGATREEDLSSVDFIKGLDIDTYFHLCFVPYTGSELFGNLLEEGRISPSSYILPYQYRHDYDIGSLSQLENSWQYYVKSDRIRKHIVSSLTGPVTERQAPVLLEDPGAVTEKDTEWMEKTVPAFSLLGFKGKRAAEYLELNAGMLSRANLPFIGCFSLAEKKGRGRSVVYDVSFRGAFTVQHGYSSFDMGTLTVIPFSARGTAGPSSGRGPRGSFRLYSLKTQKDMAEFAGFLERSLSGNGVVLEGEMAACDTAFINECMWRSRECPALYLGRAVLGKNGDIRSCPGGPRIGGTGDDAKTLGQNMKKKQEALAVERGCADCPADSYCPKCALSPPGYCGIMRSGHGVKSFFLLLDILRKIRVLSRPGRSSRVKASFHPGHVKITNGKRKYIYDAATGDIFAADSL